MGHPARAGAVARLTRWVRGTLGSPIGEEEDHVGLRRRGVRVVRAGQRGDERDAETRSSTASRRDDDDDEDRDDEDDDELEDAAEDEIDFVIAAYREDGQPLVQALDKDLANDLEELIVQLRRLPGDAGALGFVSLVEEVFVLVRVRGQHVQVLLSTTALRRTSGRSPATSPTS